MATTKRTHAPQVQTGDPANLRRGEDGDYTDVTDAEVIYQPTPEGKRARKAKADEEAARFHAGVAEIQAAVDAADIPAKPTRRKGQRRTPAEKVAEGKAKAAKVPKAETPRAACLCGCGETPKGKKARYLAGHDSRHFAALKAAGKKVTFLLPEDKRASHAEKVRAKRAAKRAENDRLTREALDRVGITPITGSAPKVTRRRKAAQAEEAVAS